MINANVTLPLEEARSILRRAVDKAEELGQRGSFVVVDEAGVVVTGSRMDGTGILSYPISRAKAHLAVSWGISSGHFFQACKAEWYGIFAGFQEVIRDKIFPGPGAQVIMRSGRKAGALSGGAGVAPFVKFPGVHPSKLIADGKPANAEDLCASYALRQPYAPQHGDDMPKWIEAYGSPPEGQGTALDEAPRSTKQVRLDAAIRLCDAAIAEAQRRKLFICVTVVDRHGDVIQIDRMDHAAPMTPDTAEAVAITATNFAAPSSRAAQFPDVAGLARVAPFKLLAVAGGLPLIKEGHVAGAIGVSGADPEECEAIARVALDAFKSTQHA